MHAKPSLPATQSLGTPTSDANTRGPDVKRFAGYDAVRIILGLVLLTAAALKGYQLATEPVAETSLLSSRWFLIGVVEFELFFGLWLLAGVYPKWTHRAAMGCFGLFACVTLVKALSGEVSCGCFGNVSVNPWYTFVLDAGAVAALLCCRPTSSNFAVSVRAMPFGFRTVVGLSLVAGVPAALAMASYRAGTIGEVGEILGNGNIVFLDPEEWVGKRFPLLKYIDIGDQLAEGAWIVVMYHNDCPKCQHAIPSYEQMAQQRAYRPDAPGVALIEVQRGGRQLAKQCPSCSHGRLAEDRKWFIETPTVVVLLSGIVMSLGYDVESTRFVSLGRVDCHTRGALSARGRMSLEDADLIDAALICGGDHAGQLSDSFRLGHVVSLGLRSSALVASPAPVPRRSMSASRQLTDHAHIRKESWLCDARSCD